MSNAIFPSPSLPAGSRGWPVKKWPVFDTIVQTPASKRGETRISKTPYCLWKFSMTFPKLNSTFNDPTGYLAKVAGFYMQMQGQAASWLYNDPRDSNIPSSAPATFGLGDGVTTGFQLSRPIGNYADIIQNLNGAPSIYLAGVLQSSGYSVDSLGVVTFNLAPALNVVLAWSGSYYFRCRFLADELSDLQEIAPNFWQIQTLEWVSVIQ